ncbi:LCP family protein [Tessaracoccus sp. SD287]|uniref:LCP family protein n=1 Tax=Tessaracoccus sp. SD287 TaxID=2782008 RepID=UPI001A95F9B5|nr:LCP family protein [Tessaracoccus sp. SD287]MBO1032307.1 LCP family protein [Tessaracoccus sp. SD287]
MSEDHQVPPGDGYDAYFRPSSRPRRAIDDPDSHPSTVEDDGADEPTVIRPLPAAQDAAPAAAPAAGRRVHPFTRALGWTTLGAFLPGLGLWPTRMRRWGIVLFGLLLAFLVAAGLYVMGDPFEAAKIAARTNDLLALCVGLVVVAVLWVTLIVGTHLLTRPRTLTSAQRAVGALVVSALAFVVATPLAVAARYSWDQANLVQDVFGKNDTKKSGTRPTINTDTSSDEVWKNHPRLNILLVGLDNSSEREYADTDVSTDTMMVASIDTQTGDMVLVQVPRNMAKTPFAPGSKLASLYPDGYTDGHGDNAAYFANAIWAHVPAEHPDLFVGTDYPGADALKLGLEGAVGLKIDYFVALNIDGLVGLIDAMGGVTLNVNERLPIGGDSSGRRPVGYLEPGPSQKLSGYNAMWYARSRLQSTDFDRMSRQSCVIKAVVNQADPQTLLTRYEAIARAGGNAVTTDIPSDMLPHLVDLSARVKDGEMRRVLFVHGQNGYVTYGPDFAMMQRRVADAIEELGGTAPTMPLVTPTPEATPTGQSTPLDPSTLTSPSPTSTDPDQTPGSTGTPTPKPIENLNDACAYNPK